jgi:hypothetical protein
VIQRPEQQDGVHGRIGQVDVPRIADRGADPVKSGRVRRELPDVQRHQVPVLDQVPERRQPERVPARPAADVGDDRGRVREAAADDLGGPLELQLAAPGAAQPVPLQAALVVRVKRWFGVHAS